ncbi:unnamed protein product [Malus baccata var. baccata]
MERVKVAPPKAIEMSLKVKYTSVYHIELCFCQSFPGTFTSSEYIGVHSGRLSKIKPLAQLDKVCILSCVIPIGLGAPLNVAKRKIILSCYSLASLLLKVQEFMGRD